MIFPQSQNPTNQAFNLHSYAEGIYQENSDLRPD